MEDGVKSALSQTFDDSAKVISQYKKRVQKERCDKVAFLGDGGWFEFAVRHCRVRDEHYRVLYGYAYTTIQTMSTDRQLELATALVRRLRQDEFVSNILPKVFKHMDEPQKALLRQINLPHVSQDIWETGLPLIESKNPRDNIFRDCYFSASMSIFLKALTQDGREVENTNVITILDYVFVAVLKKRYSLIKGLPSASLISTISFDRKFFDSLSCFLNRELQELSAELLEKLSIVIRNWLPKIEDFVPMRGNVRSQVGALYASNGPIFLLDGGMLNFMLESLNNEEDHLMIKDGKSCLLEFLCLYLNFCLNNKKTLTNHEFARWVITLCERCSSQFRVW